MGQVHVARHRSGHLVAIKKVRKTLSADPVVRDRLANEARLLQRVKHPNVVRAVDSGHDPSGHPYLVMDRAHGTPLDQLIAKTGPLPYARVAVIARQLLAGLAAIHAAGVVHADVKSNNIMVGDADHVVIIDFGLARSLSRTDLRGLIAGTPSYIAPEVIGGAPPTSASDVYAAGAVVYEMLTGQLPFQGPARVVLACQLDGTVVPPSQRASHAGITAAVDAVVLKALAREPEQRFASARALSVELQRALAEVPSSPSIDLIELTATRDFWGARTLPAAPRIVDPVLQAAETQPIEDPDTKIDVALERVRSLLDKPDLEAAVGVLEQALDEMRQREGDELSAAAWRIESVLAALYDRLGRGEAALRVARLAYTHALRTGSESAKLRTRELLTRLEGRARPSLARGSRPLVRPPR